MKIKHLREGELTQSKLEEVARFLKEFKDIAVLSGIFVIPRAVNNDALIDLGVTKAEREAIILSLTPTIFVQDLKLIETNQESFGFLANPLKLLRFI